MPEERATNLVSLLVSELRADPVRFRATDGYIRLTKALEAGNNPKAVKEYLGEATEFAGDVLWSIAELEDVTDYVGEALHHLASADKGTAGYAMEIVLRAGHAPELRAVFEQWRVCDEALCEKAACDLSWQGTDRLGEVLAAAGEGWCSALALKLSSTLLTRSEIAGALCSQASLERATPAIWNSWRSRRKLGSVSTATGSIAVVRVIEPYERSALRRQPARRIDVNVSARQRRRSGISASGMTTASTSTESRSTQSTTDQ